MCSIKECAEKFRKNYWKTPAPGSLFELQPAPLLKRDSGKGAFLWLQTTLL